MRRKWILIAAAVLIQIVLLAGCSKTEAPEITSIEQLNDNGYSVGVGEGAAGMFAVEEHLPEAEMLLYSSNVTGYAAVQQGELDAYAYDRIMMEFAIAGELDGVRLYPQPHLRGVLPPHQYSRYLLYHRMGTDLTASPH